jgi:hypothetical protein
MRQSKPNQLIQNQESQRLQYGLVEQQLGFRLYRIITTWEDRLRPGGRRFVLAVIRNRIVFAWRRRGSHATGGVHHLIELVEYCTVVADPDGV